MPDLNALLDDFRRGERHALSKLLSRVAHGETMPAMPRPSKACRVVALTGSGGVGKSTLIGKLIELLRNNHLKVAVLACDPQSPLSGGALLGDRFRMPSRPDDDGVFIRSLAALSGRGAVAENLPAMVRLLEAFGFDVVLIETVGAGQGDTTVHALADVVVLLLQPETGDDLQYEKAGVLEVADIITIQKADLPGAEQTAAQVRASLDLPGNRQVPIVLVSAKSGSGVAELWQTITACRRHRDVDSDTQRELLRLALTALTRRFESAVADGSLRQVLHDWKSGQLGAADAGAAALQALSR